MVSSSISSVVRSLRPSLFKKSESNALSVPTKADRLEIKRSAKSIKTPNQLAKAEFADNSEHQKIIAQVNWDRMGYTPSGIAKLQKKLTAFQEQANTLSRREYRQLNTKLDLDRLKALKQRQKAMEEEGDAVFTAPDPRGRDKEFEYPKYTKVKAEIARLRGKLPSKEERAKLAEKIAEAKAQYSVDDHNDALRSMEQVKEILQKEIGRITRQEYRGPELKALHQALQAKDVKCFIGDRDGRLYLG